MGDKRDIEGGSGEWEGGGSVVKYVVVECQASKLARKYLANTLYRSKPGEVHVNSEAPEAQ